MIRANTQSVPVFMNYPGELEADVGCPIRNKTFVINPSMELTEA